MQIYYSDILLSLAAVDLVRNKMGFKTPEEEGGGEKEQRMFYSVGEFSSLVLTQHRTAVKKIGGESFFFSQNVIVSGILKMYVKPSVIISSG